MLASGYLFVEYVFCPGHFLLLKDDIGESVINVSQVDSVSMEFEN